MSFNLLLIYWLVRVSIPANWKMVRRSRQLPRSATATAASTAGVEISDPHIQSDAILNRGCCNHAVCTAVRRLLASGSTRAF
jgi:hypothetical protein